MKKLTYSNMCKEMESARSFEEAEFIWKTFYNMAALSFIPYEWWNNFFAKYRDYDVQDWFIKNCNNN